MPSSFTTVQPNTRSDWEEKKRMFGGFSQLKVEAKLLAILKCWLNQFNQTSPTDLKLPLNIEIVKKNFTFTKNQFEDGSTELIETDTDSECDSKLTYRNKTQQQESNDDDEYELPYDMIYQKFLRRCDERACIKRKI